MLMIVGHETHRIVPTSVSWMCSAPSGARAATRIAMASATA